MCIGLGCSVFWLQHNCQEYFHSTYLCIDGNNNVNVVIIDVTFRGFEVAAISLNNVDKLKLYIIVFTTILLLSA